MPYLIQRDYRMQIQKDNLMQVIGDDATILADAQAAGEAQAVSHLVQKFDVGSEMTDTSPFEYNRQYLAGQRATIDFPAFDESIAYSLGDAVHALVDGKYYGFVAKAAVSAGPFNESEWDNVGNQYTIYYGKSPFPEFNVYKNYILGTKVYWKGKVYQCLKATQYINPLYAQQYDQIENIPLPNVFPDDPQNGLTYWGPGQAYSIPPHTLPTNETYWVKGDNRDPQLRMIIVDLTLYHVHTRIAPRNVPNHRQARYDDAITWLRMCAEGDVTPAIPRKQPNQGMRIRYGGPVKKQNDY